MHGWDGGGGGWNGAGGIRADKVKAQQAAQVAKKSERRLMVPDGGAACRCNKRTRTAAARTQWSPQQLYPCNLALRGGGRITIRSARLHSVNRWPHGSSYSQVPLPSPLQTRRRSTSARAASAPAWMTTCMTAWARTMSTTSCKRRGRSDLCARAPLRAWCPLAVASGANQAAPAPSAPAVPSPARPTTSCCKPPQKTIAGPGGACSRAGRTCVAACCDGRTQHTLMPQPPRGSCSGACPPSCAHPLSRDAVDITPCPVLLDRYAPIFPQLLRAIAGLISVTRQAVI